MTIQGTVALLLAGALLASGPAFANCSSPLGVAGDQFYNTTYNVMQFCNGTGWINMGVSVNGGIGGLTNGDFCTSDGLNVNCNTITSPLPVANGGTGASTLANLISLTADISGVLGVANGGTGLSAGTSGGVLYYSGTGTLASSGALSQYQVVLGGGAGATPVTIGTTGVSGYVLTSNGSGAAPTWQAAGGLPSLASGDIWIGNGSSVAIATALPLSVAHGGTGDSTLASSAILIGNGISAVTTLGIGTGLASSGGNLNVSTPVTATMPTFSVCTYTSSSTACSNGGFGGSGTYTTPAGVKWIHIRMIGGGGGGGGSGNSATGGSSGGNTTFGSSGVSGCSSTALLIACAGAAGGNSGAGGSGGAAYGGNINITGGQGPYVSTLGNTGNPGAASPFGGAGAPVFYNNGTSASASSGSGGAGGMYNSGSYSGGGGAAGGYLEAFIANPSSTYSYAVGVGGSGGSAGSGGYAGGNGGSGIIIVEEHYDY